MKKFIALLLALVMVFALVACGNSDTPSTQTPGTQTPGTQSPDTGKKEIIKIGVLQDYSGATSFYGEVQTAGYEFAVEDFMKNHPDVNFTIELVKADTTGVADVGCTQFEMLVNNKNVSAVVGPYSSGVAGAVAPLAIRYSVPFVISNATTDSILANGQNKYVYRTNGGNLDMGIAFSAVIAMTQAARKEAGMPALAVGATISDGSDFGQSLASQMGAIYAENGIELVLEEVIVPDSGDMSTTINKLKAAGVDCVMPATYLNDSLLYARQAQEYELGTVNFGFGGGFVGDDFLKQAGEAAEGFINVPLWAYDPSLLSADGIAICEAYMTKYGRDVVAPEFANGWLCMYTLLDAIYRANSGDREAIADALLVTDIKPGARALLLHPMMEGITFNTDAADKFDRWNQNIHATFNGTQAQVNEDGNLYWAVIWPNAEHNYKLNK